jgi:CheY-like chemotaxis protein
VQQSGGLIDVQSEVGKGTCITISFPRSDEPPVQVERARTPQGLQDDALTILIVDDQREVRQVMTAMIEDLGHQVLVPRNSSEALALLAAGHRIDVLFSDVALGDPLGGVELAHRAAARHLLRAEQDLPQPQQPRAPEMVVRYFVSIIPNFVASAGLARKGDNNARRRRQAKVRSVRW